MSLVDGGKVYEIAAAMPDSPAKKALIAATVTAEIIAKREELPYTDLGNARRLIRDHGNDVRFVGGLGWLVWDGRRWAPDVDGAVMRRAKATTDDAYKRAVAELASAATREERAEAHRRFIHARASQSEPRLRAMVSLAESELAIIWRVDELDADPLALSVRNGVVDLSTGELRAHRREDAITKLAPVAFDAAATAPVWLRFLSEIMDGDEGRIRFLQRMIGYAATGLTGEQKAFLLLGPGANGKSVFARVIREVLGPDYVAQIDFDTFLVKERGGTRGDLVRLRGKRLVTASELAPGERLDERRVKEMLGGEAIVARQLYQNEVEFRPIAKIIWSANVAPVVRGTDFGIWRRLLRIPFAVTIAPERQDPSLVDKLHAEAAGILVWIAEGCRAYLADGLGEDPAATAATAEWRAESDQVARWLVDACTRDSSARVTRKAARSSYVSWAEAEGEHPVSARALADELRRLGARDGVVRDQVSKKPVHGWHGVAVASSQIVATAPRKVPKRSSPVGSSGGALSTGGYVATEEDAV